MHLFHELKVVVCFAGMKRLLYERPPDEKEEQTFRKSVRCGPDDNIFEVFVRRLLEFFVNEPICAWLAVGIHQPIRTRYQHQYAVNTPRDSDDHQELLKGGKLCKSVVNYDSANLKKQLIKF